MNIMTNKLNKENKKLIRLHKKYLNQYLKWNWFNLAIFIFDFSLFISIIVCFIINTFIQHLSEITKFAIKYFILTGSFYTLIKFTITNFFYSDSYFKKIQIYNKEIQINKTKLIMKKNISFVSISFLIVFNLMNIIIAIILNYQTSTLFSEQEFIKALVLALSNLLLIPSFVSSLSKIFKIKESANNNYKKLIRDQFLANIDLFKKCKPVNDYEYIQFNNLELKSLRGIFFLTSYQNNDIKNNLIKNNKDILFLYEDIWNNYCQYLVLINGINIKSFNKYKTFYITRVFDQIFINFFDV